MSIVDQWREEGYLIFRDIYEQEEVAKLRLISDDCLSKWRVRSPESGTPGGGPESTVMRHLNHTDYHRDEKANLAYLLDAVAKPNILDIAEDIIGDRPLFRSTSYFFNPISGGVNGNWHRDSQFNNQDDEVEKNIILERAKTGSGLQMQIALAPSDDVEYVPGSHLRWDSEEEYHIRKAEDQKNNTSDEMPGALRVSLEPGDAVIFNPIGLHRGRYHTEPVRRTLMWTYTAESRPNSDYFSMQPWCLEEGYLDGVKSNTREFFEAFISAYAQFWRS